MSQENVEIVRRGIDVINEGKLKAVFEFIDEFADPDFEMRTAGHLPDVGRGRGREAAKAMWAELMGTFEWRFETEEIIDVGDAVIVVTRQIARGRGSGAEVTNRVVMVFGFCDRRVTSADAYKTRSEALEAAGLGW
jgi:ketosteroid isomerase-like protein